MNTKNLKITSGSINISLDTIIDNDTEYKITCSIKPTGKYTVDTNGENTKETWNMSVFGNAEILDTKTKEKVGVINKTTPSQLLRLVIKNRAEKNGIVDIEKQEAYYEKVMNNLINQLK